MVKFTGHTITPDSALGGTKIEKSVRLNKTDSAYFERTVSSGGNQKVWTWSAWFKRSRLHDDGGTSYLFSCNNVSGNNGIAGLYIQSDNLRTYFDTTGTNPYGAVNSRVFRDMTSWMHIVWQVDASNTSQKIWINGVELSLDSSLNPPDYSYGMNQSGIKMFVGRDGDWGSAASNMYIAEVHYSDGTKYQASDFGYTDAQTGQWRPKNGNVVKSNITYGTNGYWLDFRDNTSTTTLGYDYSGNGNHFTATNISVSAGSDNDSMIDTPTNNFPTLAGDTDDSGNAPTDGNLQGGTAGTSGWRHTRSTVPLPSSGKWYWEYKVPDASANASNGWMTGIAYSNLGFTQDINSDSTGLYGRQTESKYNNSSGSPVTDSHFSTVSNNDILQFAYDADSQTLFTGRNNTWELSANPSTGANPNWTGVASGGFPMVGSYGSSRYIIINFGQQGFSYTPPTGYASLSPHNRATANAAGVVNPKRHFDCLIWDGDSAHNRKITGLEFKPDMVWIKSRNGGTYGGGLYYHHMIWDILRGVGSDTIGSSSRKELTVNESYQEGRGANYTDYYGHVSSFDNNGFELDHVTGEPPLYVNRNTNTYVAWCWKAGGAGVANSDGSISSTVSVNQEAGFSMLLYTGTGSSATVGHGLNDTPEMIWTKSRSTSGSWAVLDTVGNTTAEYGLFLNDNGGYSSYQGGTYWSDTLPTSSVFTVNSNAATNASGVTYIAYCWRSIPGYSKMGKYTGNGSSDGPVIHLGFRPAWFMQKKVSGSGNWYIFDNKRSGSNVDNDMLSPNLSDSEYDGASYPRLDFLASGIKWRDAGSSVHNASGETYIYMAFAERPSNTIFGLDANAR